MQCAQCKTELDPGAKFCPECGAPVKASASINVEQEIGTVNGATVTGAVLSRGALPAGLNLTTSQKVDRAEAGSVVTGAVIGGEGNVHLGGEQHYDQRRTDTQYGGIRVGGNLKAGGDVVSGDKVTVGNITGSTGVAIGKNARATVSGAAGHLTGLFAAFYVQIETRAEDPTTDKGELTQMLQTIEDEAGKGEQANPAKVARWLKLLLDAAPDIGQGVRALLAHPNTGFAPAVRAAAQRVQ